MTEGEHLMATDMDPQRRLLVDTLLALADTDAAGYAEHPMLAALVRACAELLDAEAVALCLDDGGATPVATVATTEPARLLTEFELETGQGPAVECRTLRDSVVSLDLTADRDRWPRYVAAAELAGFNCVLAMPLRGRGMTIGSLDFLFAVCKPDLKFNLSLAQALADIAALGIVRHRTDNANLTLIDQLQGALISRVRIEQAKGILAERHSGTVAESFEIMRGYARRRQLLLADVARAVVEGRLDPITGHQDA